MPYSDSNRWTVVGTMSGTSLDGLDICVCDFSLNGGKWSYSIRTAETVSYSSEWKNRLANAHQLDEASLSTLDSEYSQYISNAVQQHLLTHGITEVDLMGSHGHTVFHDPSLKRTLQIGNQAELRSNLNFPVACDFRKADVELGGQGAPLVPIGDELLFGEYDVCLNLGGFANLSVGICKSRLAWDVAPVNIVLNALAQKLGAEYDDGGNMARKGEADCTLIERLNRLPYYHQSPPKSLGREWVERNILPQISHLSTEDALATMTKHSAFQIGKALHDLQANTVLCTGGGVLNQYLMELIEKHGHLQIEIPDEKLMNYKEALIFAFLGLLRWRNEVNILASVTGAPEDHCSGVLYD